MSEDATSGALPRAYGPDRVEPAAEGGVWLLCPVPKGWVPRRGRDHSASEYPGTAVRWDSELFEVVEAIAEPDGNTRYRLEPWADRHIVRAIEAYDERSDAGREEVRAGHERDVIRRRLAILFSPILGHLPAS